MKQIATMLSRSKIGVLIVFLLSSSPFQAPMAASEAAKSCFEAKDKQCLEQLRPKISFDGPEATSSDYDAVYYLGLLFLENGNAEEAKRQLMMATAFGKGHEKSKAKLLELYENEAVQFDASECLAIESQDCLVKLANDKNDAPAQFLLGSQIIESDPENAARYLKNAADQGHKTAPCVLAEGSQNGTLKTDQSYHEAMEYLRHNCFGFTPFKKFDRKHFEKYESLPSHKAYAHSKSGISHSQHGFVKPSVAAKAALARCEQRNKQKDLPCQIINVDGRWVKNHIPSTPSEPLQGIERLLTSKAKKSFQQYDNKTAVKVFVQSEIGSWSWKSSGTDTLEDLTAKVLKRCNSQSGKLRDDFPCQVVNANGEWK